MIDIIRYCRDERLLGFDLWPAQECMLRAAFGLEMPPELVPLWHQLAETDRPYEPRRYSQIVWAVGRQSGKSRLVRAAAGYQGLVEDPAQHLAETEYAMVPVVATSQGQARRVCVAPLTRELLASPALAREVVRDDNRARDGAEYTSVDQVVFRNRTLVHAVPCNSRAARGYPAPAIVFEEIAHYARETGSTRADVEVMRAVMPSLRVFRNLGKSRVWMISSPQARDGAFHEAYARREERREWQLTMRAPTWAIDPAWDPAQWASEREADPLGFAIEYGAEFAEMIEGLFFREDVDAALARRGPLPPEASRVYWGRIDPAFVRDRFGVGVGHREGEHCRVDLLEAVAPPAGGAVDLAGVLRLVERLHREYRPRKWRTDQYAGEPIAQLLRAKGIPVEVQPWGAGYKKTIYSTFVSLVKRRRFEAPWSALADRELIRLQQRVSKSGQVTIGHPAGSGESDDLADVCAGLAHDCMTERQRRRRDWGAQPL